MADLVLGDDHAVFVDALVTVLPQRGLNVLDTADSITETVRCVRRNKPDVCVLERFFTDGDSLERMDEIVAAGGPRMRVLLLTADSDAAAMRRAMRAGAIGYVTKMCGVTALVEAVGKAAMGEPVTRLPRFPDGRASTASARTARAPAPLRMSLTPREHDCLRLLVAGARTTTMANRLGVSSTTVRTHVQALLSKLGVHSRLEAATFAVRHSLLDPPEGDPSW
ncbi:two component transcriptional regulator, LuxR family [Actinopolyspora xinjiangensis]|uniref:Two component transcriptional regulator, LuxR family n=1 Tax=Actinopolyspora xinjiangensis TaxID=405564 RepID=A0A1H0WUS7_9ACTN|nr:response regulator transcription factor [Actinopolyspora xinjiangensis]SDP94407.1 two component transcriptional regulator, LuxR family [Actinopolyspora xinjiangensis]